MSTFVETRRRAKHSFKCTGISANKPLLPSVAIPPDSKVLNWKANIRTQCTLLLCLTSGSGRYLHIFVCTSRSVCASRSGRYLHRGNHTQVPVCRKHFQFASQQTLDIVHIEISYWEVLQANCTLNEKLALSFLVLLFIVAWKKTNNQNMKRWRAAHKWTWVRSLDEG